MSKPSLSLQLFSMKSLGTFEAQFSAAARAGYRQVELLEEHLREASEIRNLLARHALEAPSAHVGLHELRTRWAQVIDACHQCGTRMLFVPHLDSPEAQRERNYWLRFGHELGEMAERLKAEGLILGYHNKLEGLDRLLGHRYGLELLFDAAKGSVLVWQADIGWLARAQASPAEWLRRYANILVSAHIKDQAPESEDDAEGGWSDVGAGLLVWPSLWRAAVSHGAGLLVVEHDKPREPFSFAEASLKYLTRFVDSTDVSPAKVR